MKILYAEDEPAMSEAVTDILTYHNYQVDAVYNGQEALDYARCESYDAIILDIMMPKMNGLEVLTALRNAGDKTPILLLTAKAQVEDQIAGLDLGADDYLPKPFPMELLLARVRALLRRPTDFTPDLLTCGDLTLNRQNYTLACNGQVQNLPKLEYQLMEVFMLNVGTIHSTEDLLCKVWGYDTEAEIGVVWVYISYLRKRLKTMGSNVSITLKRNLGYTLKVNP